MIVRKFYFENGLGDKYELTNKTFKTFLYKPKGLGFTKSIATQRLGDSELLVNETYDTPKPNGEILFYDTGKEYQSYFDFIKFISYEPLKFGYIPTNSIEPYYIDCQVVQLEKTEIDDDGVMHCPIVIYGLSMWKTAKQYEMTLRNTFDTDGKHYPLVRPYHYANSTLANIDFNNNGTLPTGFIIEVDGEVQNMQLTAYDEKFNKVGVAKINGTFDYIRINTNDTEQEIELQIDGSVVANPTAYQDLSIADGKAVMTFFKLPVGKSKLVFTCGNIETFDGTVKFKWNNKFISV